MELSQYKLNFSFSIRIFYFLDFLDFTASTTTTLILSLLKDRVSAIKSINTEDITLYLISLLHNY